MHLSEWNQGKEAKKCRTIISLLRLVLLGHGQLRPAGRQKENISRMWRGILGSLNGLKGRLLLLGEVSNTLIFLIYQVIQRLVF